MRNGILTAWCMVAATLCAQSNPNRLYQTKDLQQSKLKFGAKTISVWVMDTASKRQEGMMFLTAKEVPTHKGMLFAFTQPQPLSFWMRNTLIDLDIAYLDANGVAVSVHRMKRLDETSVPSAAPAKFALEMKAGDFKALGIKKGTRFAIPKDVAAKN